MFTGLVEGQGTVRQIASLPVGLRLSIAPDTECFPADEVAIGDSISICGCCLTVVAMSAGSLNFEAGTETLSKTNLGLMKVGSRVNLERSLAANARLGGHFVQGHVDGVATVSKIVCNGDWIDLWFTPAVEQHVRTDHVHGGSMKCSYLSANAGSPNSAKYRTGNACASAGVFDKRHGPCADLAMCHASRTLTPRRRSSR